MRVQIQLRIVSDDDTVLNDHAVLRLDRIDDRLAAVGLSLAEAKTLLAGVHGCRTGRRLCGPPPSLLSLRPAVAEQGV